MINSIMTVLVAGIISAIVSTIFQVYAISDLKVKLIKAEEENKELSERLRKAEKIITKLTEN